MKIKEFIQAKGYTKGNNGRLGIVIHYVNNPDSTAKATANYFKNNNSGSAHYVVGLSGEIYQCVKLDDTAWAVGIANGTYEQKHKELNNGNTISIEMCHTKDGFKPETVNAALDLVKSLMMQFKTIKYVVRHYDIVNKVCPAFWVNDIITDAALHPLYNKETEQPEDWKLFQGACFSDCLRVRPSWDKAYLQIGAYVYPDNAKKCADDNNMNVYDSQGNLLYKGKTEHPTFLCCLDYGKPLIKAVQIALIDAGCSLPVYGADGILGNETKNAINLYRMKHNLHESTEIDSELLEALF